MRRDAARDQRSRIGVLALGAGRRRRHRDPAFRGRLFAASGRTSFPAWSGRASIVLGLWLSFEAFTGGWRGAAPDDARERGEHAFHAAGVRLGHGGPVRAHGADRLGRIRDCRHRAVRLHRARLRQHRASRATSRSGSCCRSACSCSSSSCSTSTCPPAGSRRCWAARGSDGHLDHGSLRCADGRVSASRSSRSTCCGASSA